jgi:hypothetical protein
MIQSLTCRVLAVRSNDAPKLLAALRDMKDGLDLVKGKVEALTRKVLTLSLFPPSSFSTSLPWQKLERIKLSTVCCYLWWRVDRSGRTSCR